MSARTKRCEKNRWNIKFTFQFFIKSLGAYTYICFVETFMCRWHSVCYSTSPAESRKNWREKKVQIVFVWKRVGERRIKREREREKNINVKKNLFYSDSMETINYRWYSEWYIKYPLRLLRGSAFNDDINLLYEISFFSHRFSGAFSFQLLFTVCASDAWNWNCQNLLCCFSTWELMSMRIFCMR